MKSLLLLASFLGLAQAQPTLSEMEVFVFSDVIPSMRPQFFPRHGS